MINSFLLLFLGNVKRVSLTYSPSPVNDNPVVPDNVVYTPYEPTADQPQGKLEIKFEPFISTVVVTITLEDTFDNTPEYQVWLSIVACFEGNYKLFEFLNQENLLMKGLQHLLCSFFFSYAITLIRQSTQFPS